MPTVLRRGWLPMAGTWRYLCQTHMLPIAIYKQRQLLDFKNDTFSVITPTIFHECLFSMYVSCSNVFSLSKIMNRCSPVIEYFVIEGAIGQWLLLKLKKSLMLICSTAERRNLRGQMKCQSFKWYLDNVLPQLKPLSDDDFIYGRIRQGTHMCMDIALGHVPVLASLSLCSEEKNSQVKSGHCWLVCWVLLTVVVTFFYKNSLFTLLIFIVGKDDMP